MKEQIWLSNVKYFRMSLQTSYSFAKEIHAELSSKEYIRDHRFERSMADKYKILLNVSKYFMGIWKTNMTAKVGIIKLL